ncbi:MAG: NAD-dependent deacetylase [Polyangiales bacterium]|jgi:NAD-dependent deacetylase
MSLPSELDAALARRATGPVVWLTGAGISAESGIPTFRGPEGYWRVGSENYRPEELATFSAFQRMPKDVWAWYLYRRATCRAAEPNAAHHALVRAEQALGDDFLLITQNVDGLHERAGQSQARTYAIHGNVDWMRPVGGRRLEPIPAYFDDWTRERAVSVGEMEQLSVEGEPARPHVLWFDEMYDEEHFRFESAQRAALNASALIIVGSQGTTNLPSMIASTCLKRGVPVVVVDPADGRFTEAVRGRGHHLRGPASEWVPPLVEHLIDLQK